MRASARCVRELYERLDRRAGIRPSAAKGL